MTIALELAQKHAEQALAEAAHRDDQPPLRRWPKLGNSVLVHYENPHLGVECDIEIPVNAKTKQARLGNGMGLAMLAYGASIKSDWRPTA